MAAPVTSSTSTMIADNQDASDINVTDFGAPWTAVTSVTVENNAAPDGLSEGIHINKGSAGVNLEQIAAGTSFASSDFSGQIIYTGRRQKININNGHIYDNGGYGCFIRDGGGNFRAWKFGGLDDGYDNDTMRVRIIDPEVPGDEVEDAGFDVTDVDAVGYYLTSFGTGRPEFIILQTYRCSDISVTRGDSTTPATWKDLALEINENAGAYGLEFMSRIGASLYRGCGRYTIGANDANEHRFVQYYYGLEFFQKVNDLGTGGASNAERYGAVIQDNSFGLTIEVGSDFYLELGFAIAASNNSKWYFIINGNGNTSQTCDFTSHSFVRIGINSFDAPASFNGCPFALCDKLNINGASFVNAIIENPDSGTACAVTPDSVIDGTSFSTATPTDYAIEIPVVGAYNWAGVTYSGFTTDVNVTATTGTVAINISGGGDTPTFITAGATVVILSIRTLTIKNIPSGGILEIFDNDDSPADYQDKGTLLLSRNPTTGADVSYTHDKTGDGIIISFYKAGYEELDINFTLANVDQELDLEPILRIERNL